MSKISDERMDHVMRCTGQIDQSAIKIAGAMNDMASGEFITEQQLAFIEIERQRLRQAMHHLCAALGMDEARCFDLLGH